MKEKDEVGWVDWLGKMKGWKGGQLRRDLELTRQSAGSVVEIWRGLEGMRELLLGYRWNVGHFKVRFSGVLRCSDLPRDADLVLYSRSRSLRLYIGRSDWVSYLGTWVERRRRGSSPEGDYDRLQEHVGGGEDEGTEAGRRKSR